MAIVGGIPFFVFIICRVHMLRCKDSAQIEAASRFLIAMVAQDSAQIEAALVCESVVACGICNQPLNDGDDVVVFAEDPKVYDSCSHKFHRVCMDTYIEARRASEDQAQCPQCEMAGSPLGVRQLVQPSAAAKPVPSVGAVEVCAAQSAPTLPVPSTPEAGSSSLVVPVMDELRRLSDKCEQMVLCNLCGGKVELSKSIIRSKQAGTFRCKVCHSKCEIIRRKCGGFPPDVFANLTEQQKQDFFTRTKGTAMSLQSELQRINTAFKRTEKTWALGGEFRPLGYWKTLGYDEKRIEANSDPDDVRECRVAGTVYRVPVMSHGKRHSNGTEEVDQQRISQTPAKRLQLKGGKWVVGGSDEDDSSSSSEESSIAHGDAKAVLAKAKRKAARIAEKAKHKAAKKSAQAKLDLANANRDAKANEKREGLKLKHQEAKLKLQVKATEHALNAEKKAADSRKKIAKDGSSLLGKAIKSHSITETKARVSGICPHALASLNLNIEEAKAAKEACDDVISDPHLTDKLPGDGDLKSIKAIISKVGRTAAYVNSLCGK